MVASHLIMGINGCATGLALYKYIVEMEWLRLTGTGFLMSGRHTDQSRMTDQVSSGNGQHQHWSASSEH
jgi:hypothetical protein